MSLKEKQIGYKAMRDGNDGAELQARRETVVKEDSDIIEDDEELEDGLGNLGSNTLHSRKAV
jgi:hypothetical protein